VRVAESTLIENYEVEVMPRRRPTSPETLENLIESKQVTRDEFARETEIPRSTITNVLSGRHQFSNDNVTRLAKFFYVDPSLRHGPGASQ